MINMQKPDLIFVVENEGIRLRKTGKSYRGKCPVHSGKTHGSLAVYPEDQSWYCYGCTEGGDVISFVMKAKGLSFKDALTYLGIEKGKPIKVDPGKQRQRQVQMKFEAAVKGIWWALCDESIELHRVRIAVQESPRILTDDMAVEYAEAMVRLAEVDNALNILWDGTTEEQSKILEEHSDDNSKDIDRRANQAG